MGACISIPAPIEVSEADKLKHREAEKQLREVSHSDFAFASVNLQLLSLE